MYRKLQILLFLLLMNAGLYAQTLSWRWARAINGAGTEDKPVILPMANGDLIVAGNYTTNPLNLGGISLPLGGSPDLFLARYDAAGTLLWARHLVGSGTASPADMVQTGNNHFLLGGSFNGTLNMGGGNTLSSAAQTDAFLLELDGNGNFVWAKKMGSSGDDLMLDLEKDAAGNTYIMGDFGANGFSIDGVTLPNSPLNSPKQSFFGKLDAAGSVQWMNKVEGNAYRLHTIKIFNNGNLNLACALPNSTHIYFQTPGGAVQPVSFSASSFGGSAYGSYSSATGQYISWTQVGSSTNFQGYSANSDGVNLLMGGMRRFGLSLTFFGSIESPATSYQGVSATNNSAVSIGKITPGIYGGWMAAGSSTLGLTLPYGVTTTSSGSEDFFIYGFNGEDQVLTSNSQAAFNEFIDRLEPGAAAAQVYVAGRYSAGGSGLKFGLGSDSLLHLGGSDIFIGAVKKQVLPLKALAGPDKNICQGQTVILGGNPSSFGGSGPISYSWSPAASLNNPGAANPVASPTVSTTYILTVSDNFGGLARDTVQVNIFSYPSMPVITAGGPTNFCLGDSVLLTSSPGSGYLWNVGATTRSIWAKAPGPYAVKLVNGGVCESPASALTLVRAVQAASKLVTVSGSPAICQGDSVLLTAGTANKYLWNTGATTQSIWAKTQGRYYAQLTTQVSGLNQDICTVTSDTVAITVSPVPDAGVSIGGPATFCTGDSVILTANTSGLTYTWLNGNTIVAATQSLKVTASGVYSVVLNAGNGCSAASVPITVTVNPLPATPVITQSGNQLSCIPAGNCQWFNNGIAIPGATAQTITISTGSNYSVAITNASGCRSQSAQFTAILRWVTSHFDFQVYPSPVIGNLQLVYRLKEAGNINIRVVNSLGRTVAAIVNNQVQQPGDYQFSLRNFAKTVGRGVYFIQLKWNGKTTSRRILVGN